MAVPEMFEADDEYGEFDRIPEADRRHVRPDLCAFLYLHEKLGSELNNLGTHNDMVVSAEHDQIWLGYDEEAIGKLTRDDVIYLQRCGVMFDEEAGSLSMFV